MTAPRLLSELCAYYRKTPSARDVYVEGLTDARILNREFQDSDLMEIVAYSVDSVIFDSIDATNLPHSNRKRVQLLIEYVSRCDPSVKGNVIGLIDADFDHYNDATQNTEFLVTTEWGDLTCHFCTDQALTYSLRHIFGDDVDIDTVVENLTHVSQQLFCIRHALQNIAPSIKFPQDPADGCEVARSKPFNVTLDTERLVNQILGPPANAMHLKHDLISKIEQTTLRNDLQALQQINGHDFIALLRKLLIKRGRNRFTGGVSAEGIEALVYASQPAVKLRESITFRSIVQALARVNGN